MIENLPPETSCVLTPKKDCDVLTITVPKGDNHRTGIAFDLWLAISTRTKNQNSTKQKHEN